MFKILIVEDDKELSLLFQKVLEKSGYQVKSASDGAQALEVLDREYIDLIISDIMMPVMDGYELVSELRSAGYQIPVLMITAKSSFDDMRQGFLSGSDDYMVKPVNVNEMVLRVGALLRRAQILNEHKIVIGSTELDYDAMTVVTGDETLVLPKKEFLLLYKLAASPGRTFTVFRAYGHFFGTSHSGISSSLMTASTCSNVASSSGVNRSWMRASTVSM